MGKIALKKKVENFATLSSVGGGLGGFVANLNEN